MLMMMMEEGKKEENENKKKVRKRTKAECRNMYRSLLYNVYLFHGDIVICEGKEANKKNILPI